MNLDDATKRKIGLAAIVAGTAVLAVGILAAHFTGLPPEDNLGREIYPAIPRGWAWVVISQLVALGGSQIIVAGIVIGWLWDREMTWALANVGALVFTAEIIILFGMIPNEWLTLTQGTFEWTSQREAFEIPPWLVLNNEVSISYAAIKDAVSGGYSAGLLGALLVGMYKYQEWKKTAGAPKPQKVSTYGRPLVKGER